MNVHQRLKQATSSYHVQIEQTPLLAKIMSPDITMAEYSVLLQKFYGYIHPSEIKIKSTPWVSLLSDREKSPLLVNDLAALNHTPTLHFCENLPPLINAEQVLGYLYVMEGATLGGQIITKMISRRLGTTAEKQGTYFYGYGKETKAKWDEFCILLNDVNFTQEVAIIESASLTYQTLTQWMHRE